MIIGFERYTKKTRQTLFRKRWSKWCLGTELRARRTPAYQLSANLSDPAVEEGLYDSAVMRQFVGINSAAPARAR